MQTEPRKVEERHHHHNENKSQFSLNYYVGHQGRFGHQYLDFEFRRDGRLKYYNCTEYKKQDIIRKEVYTNDIVIDELKRIIRTSGILEHKGDKWPKPDKTGKQILEIRIDGKDYKFETSKIGSFSEVQNCDDPEGLTTFFYFVLDLKGLVFSLVNLHFRIRPV